MTREQMASLCFTIASFMIKATAMETTRDFEHIYELPRDEWGDLLERNGYSKNHSPNIFRLMYRQNPRSHVTSDIPQKVKALVLEHSQQHLPSAAQIEEDRYDQSVKFLIKLKDGKTIEMVLMPEKARITLCVSSQVGCAQGCVFCHTGRMGLIRNLTPSEIVGQVLFANDWISKNPEWKERANIKLDHVTNIVFMGMGEPLDNPENLIKACKILSDPYGLAIGPRHISVSTAGHLDGLKRLTGEVPKIRIALSLHHPNPAKRSRIMPINKVYPIAEVLDFLKEVYNARNDKIFIQYTIIKGVNDSIACADELIELLGETPAKVNIIPLNTTEFGAMQAPQPETINDFKMRLNNAGIRALVRYSKGQGINAACGQLVTAAQTSH